MNVSPSSSEAVRERTADPTRKGSKAYAVNRLICDPILAESAPLEVIDMESRRHRDERGRVPLEDMRVICHRLSKEKILYKALGVPPVQVRAATRYLHMLDRLRPQSPTFEERCAIWDRAVTEYMDRQHARLEAGELHNPQLKNLPLSDGMSTATHNPTRMRGCGLKAWEDLREARMGQACVRQPSREDADRIGMWEERKARAAAPEQSDMVDAAWLAAHHVDASMLDGLRGRRRERARALFDRAEPLHGSAVRLDWVIGNESLTRVLVRRWPNLRPDALLTRLGMPNKVARTALVFEKLKRVTPPPVDELLLWNRAVAHQAGLKYPRAAKWGRDGLAGYRHEQAKLRARLVRAYMRNA